MIARLARALGLRRRRTDGVLGRRGRDLYYMGVIDILQKYTPHESSPRLASKHAATPSAAARAFCPPRTDGRFHEFATCVVGERA